MPSTTNFGWTTPADTDLVKDGASAIRTLGNGIDTSFVDLKGGTTGQVLSKNSNTDLDFTWVAADDTNAIQNAIVDAKGDLISATAADTPARLAVGTNGQVLTADSTAATGLKWTTLATDTTWTYRFDATDNFKTVDYNGSNLYVLAGNSGLLYTSPDGTTWTSRTSGFGSNNINKVRYISFLSLWVAVGSNGTITTSSDGITWTARTSNMSTNAINDIYDNGSTIVAVGEGGGSVNTGGLIYSTDGTTWTRKSQTSGAWGDSYYCVIHNGTNWVIGASYGASVGSLYASTPSGTWTGYSFGTNAGIGWAVYDGTTQFYGHSGSTGIYKTTSATLTGHTQLQIRNYNAARPNIVSYYNGRIYLCNADVYMDFGTTLSANGNPTSVSVRQYLPYTGVSTAAPTMLYVSAIGRFIGINNAFLTSF